MISLGGGGSAIPAGAANGSGESVDIVNVMPKLQAGFSGELWVHVNRTKPEHAALCS
jgi:hypothetical protein